MRRTVGRVAGTLTILRHVRGQRRALHRPRQELDAERDARVRATVREAARYVPYYRDLLLAEGLEPEKIRTAADLARLPTVDKGVLQQVGERFRSASPSTCSALALRTTGSTAAPLTVHHDRASLLANIAYSERERAVETAFTDSPYRYVSLELRAAEGTVGRVQSFYAETSFRPLRPRRRPLSVDMAPEAVLEAVNRLRPEVIRSYGAYLELLFRAAAASGGLRHRPKVVTYSGDTMSAAGRDLIEHDFGIPVLSQYNAVECFKIAFTCERRNGFHVHEDLCHVRVVGRDGQDVPPGEQGEVVISNLVNRGTVLLNYRLGDLARLVDEPCECGRTSRRLADLEGRVDETIALADGRHVYPTRVWRVFRERPEILRYQLAQLAPARFELRFVAANGESGSRSAVDAADELRGILGGAEVTLSRRDALPSGPGGKFRHLVPLAGDGVGRAAVRVGD